MRARVLYKLPHRIPKPVLGQLWANTIQQYPKLLTKVLRRTWYHLQRTPSELYMTLYVFTHCPRSCLPWVAIPYKIALLPTSICSHWARLLARDDHAPLFLPRLWAFSLQRWGPWCVSHRDEELRALSGMRRSSTPSGNLFITEILKTVSLYHIIRPALIPVFVAWSD